MLVLGLQGSPRKKGNTRYLLSAFLRAAENEGAQTRLIDVADKNIVPCQEYIVCEKKGFCPIDDDLKHEIYPLIRQAEVVVMASPIFFYNMTAQLKALVDRCQLFWGRKYRLKLSDPTKKVKRGLLLSVAATQGKNLFEGLKLTCQFFFDAIDARFEDSLTYRGIEGPQDMSRHPDVLQDVAGTAKKLLQPLQARKKVLFFGRRNACCSQIAAAFAQYHGSDRLEVMSAGSQPEAALNEDMVAAMHEKGIDMLYRRPQSLEAAVGDRQAQMIIAMDPTIQVPQPAGVRVQRWDLPDPQGKSPDFMREVRDSVEAKVHALIDDVA